MSERPHEKMEFNGYLVFLDAQSCQVALSKLDAERVCAVRASMFGVDRHVAHIHHRVWGAVGTWWPSIHALGGVAETAIAGAVFSTLHYGGNRTEAIARAHAATRDEARREVLASLHRPTAESVLHRAPTSRGACRLSIGLGAFLPASGRDEREFSLGRDQLLFTVTETNALLPSGPDDGHRGRLIAGHQRRERPDISRDGHSASLGASRRVMAIGCLSTVLRDRDGHHWVAEARARSSMG